jgi:hypothetical protein
MEQDHPALEPLAIVGSPQFFTRSVDKGELDAGDTPSG